MNLRKRSRMSYYEPEEPSFDQYIYCEKCEDFVYEYCSVHGPLLVIPDDEAKVGLPKFVPRAAQTIPYDFLHIAPSIIPGAGLGVFSTLTLPRGVRFGPYCGRKLTDVESSYCWQIYDDNNKETHVIDASDANDSNWMRYVNCSRHFKEQNLVAYQYQGQIYYRTIKIIPRFTELLVFYGSEFAQLLGLNLRYYNTDEYYMHIQDITMKNMLASSQVSSQFSQEQNEDVPSESLISNTCNVLEDNINLAVDVGTIKDFVMIDENTANYNNIKIGNNPTFHDSNSEHKNKNGSQFQNSLEVSKNIERFENEHTCVFCFKKFARKYNFNRHLLTHNDATNSNIIINEEARATQFICKICLSKFKSFRSLNEHHQIHHTGRKRVVCVTCGKSYFEKRTLNEHVRLKHTAIRKICCFYCKHETTCARYLRRHIKTVHKDMLI